MKVYNTLTRRKDELPPPPRPVRMYVCGVTVYDLCHIGHARSAIVFDVIRRYLRYRAYDVRFVKNYTDVDDKIIKRAHEDGRSPREISERYIAEYQRDMAALGVLPADVEPRATDHIPQMLALIERLLARSVAYTADGDVYFEIARFPGYGKLSGKNLDELLAGARVEVDERKRDPRDFALWKAAKPGEPAWDSPWGPGRPGWHIECSAMSMEYLGPSFDIHGGGEDLIFPHHECEIAQSEAATGQPFARLWIHNGFVNLGAEKMSKSLGNVLTIKELVRRHQPDAIRLWLLGAHYRSPIEFAEDRLREAGNALRTLWGPVEQARKAAEAAPLGDAGGEPPAEFAPFTQRFIQAMDDDFNAPQALGVLFDFAHALNRATGLPVHDVVRGVREFATLVQVLGLSEPGPRELPLDVRERVERLIRERAEARRRRDWERADALRAEVDALGVALEDGPAGTTWRRKSP